MSVKWENKEPQPNTWRDYAFLGLIILTILSLYLGAFPSHFNKTTCEIISGVFFILAIITISLDSFLKGKGK